MKEIFLVACVVLLAIPLSRTGTYIQAGISEYSRQQDAVFNENLIKNVKAERERLNTLAH